MPRTEIPAISFYLFVIVVIMFLCARYFNENYFIQMISSLSFEKKKMEFKITNNSFLKTGFFSHTSYVILYSMGFSILTNKFNGEYYFIRNLLLVSLIYIIQIVGFYLFSTLIKNTETPFLIQRMSYNEVNNLIYMPVFLVAIYSPIGLSYLVLLVLLASLLFALLRVSIYLDGLVSGFHIILYLCTLEIIPILFLLKFIFN